MSIAVAVFTTLIAHGDLALVSKRGEIFILNETTKNIRRHPAVFPERFVDDPFGLCYDSVKGILYATGNGHIYSLDLTSPDSNFVRLVPRYNKYIEAPWLDADSRNVAWLELNSADTCIVGLDKDGQITKRLETAILFSGGAFPSQIINGTSIVSKYTCFNREIAKEIASLKWRLVGRSKELSIYNDITHDNPLPAGKFFNDNLLVVEENAGNAHFLKTNGRTYVKVQDNCFLGMECETRFNGQGFDCPEFKGQWVVYIGGHSDLFRINTAKDCILHTVVENCVIGTCGNDIIRFDLANGAINRSILNSLPRGTDVIGVFQCSSSKR